MTETTIIAGISCAAAVVTGAFAIWRGGSGRTIREIQQELVIQKVAIQTLEGEKVSHDSFDESVGDLRKTMTDEFAALREKLGTINTNVAVLRDRAERADRFGGQTKGSI